MLVVCDCVDCDRTVPKATVPHPFRLQTEARGQLHRDELAAKLAAEEARAKRLRRVTARPLPVSVDVPVVPPKPEPKPLTLPEPFPLKSLVSPCWWHCAARDAVVQ
jgi:targeting protein for Xklp2